MVKRVYADNAATTALSPKVLDKMMPYLTEVYGNPSSIYHEGAIAREAIDKARLDVANCIGASANEIIFTSGGSEANNWAIKGIAQTLKKTGKTHIISSKFEHHAVLHVLETLEKDGFEVTLLDVHEDGLVRALELEKAIRENTGLVTIMYANNEIGTIQPISDLASVCKKHGVIFHTDAVQAVGNVPINVHDQNIDMLSLTAHKFHGPKGCGALYVRKGLRLPNLIEGGAQENGKRAGTENVSGIVGLAEALKLAVSTMEERSKKLTAFRNKIVDELLKIERSRLNGDRETRLPGNINMCFHGVEGEALLLNLDLKGISASSGSACTSGSLDPSHVLLAIGLPHEIAHGSLRLSLSDDNTEEDVNYIIECVPPIIEKLRAMSPLWEKIKNDEKKGII